MTNMKSAAITGLILGVALIISFLLAVCIVGIVVNERSFDKEQVKDSWVLDGYSMAIDSCPSLKKQLKKNGVLGEHSLVPRLGSFNDGKGELSKSYFLNISSGTEGFTDFGKTQFYWITEEEETTVTTLPILKIRFFVDESKDIPTVEFVFKKDWLKKACGSKNINDDSHFDNSYFNENRYVMSDVVKYAKIRISRAEADKQIYFVMEKLIEQDLKEKELF